MKVSLRPTIKKTFIFASKNRPSFRYSFFGLFLKKLWIRETSMKKKQWRNHFIFSQKQEKKMCPHQTSFSFIIQKMTQYQTWAGSHTWFTMLRRGRTTSITWARRCRWSMGVFGIIGIASVRLGRPANPVRLRLDAPDGAIIPRIFNWGIVTPGCGIIGRST